MAFGTFLGVPDPGGLFGDADHVRTRWRACPDAALAAELDGRLAGSKYGFWPRFLTAIMSRPVDLGSRAASTRLSGIGEEDLAGVMTAVRELTGAVYPGLDLSREIQAVRAQRLGDTVLIHDGAGLQGVAICHAGAGTEAGRDCAWSVLAGKGFRRDFQGVAMHRPNEASYSTSDSYVIDDWR